MGTLERKIGRRSVVRDAQGLASVEYVILLTTIVVASAALWKRFGLTLVDRVRWATEALSSL